jgi:Kdo2-lipid IVA lauroyltransferase/acyltransferase
MEQDRSFPGRSYSCRTGPLAREITYTLAPDGVAWRTARARGQIDFANVRQLRFYRTHIKGRHAAGLKYMWFGRLRCRAGPSFVISPLHYVGFRRWEDRSVPFGAFMQSLITALRESNPELNPGFQQGWRLKLNQSIASAGSWLLVEVIRLVRVAGSEKIGAVTGWVARNVGPLLRAHRIGRANLRASFPEKSAREIEQILRGVWDNLGRVPVDVAFIDRVWDYDLEKGTGSRIVIGPETAGRIRKLRDRGGPVLCFGAHIGNWELPAVAAAAVGLKSAMVYRPPDSERLADELLRTRQKVMGRLIPAGPHAGAGVLRALREGCVVGMLTDEHARGGVVVELFGQRCFVRPTIARLARLFDCPIQGARSIRLPGNRFAFELTEALEPPRDAAGKIDVAGTMQMVTTMIEGWIREHPEQWIWLHRRWRF